MFAFHQSLYEEHFEEAVILYDRWRYAAHLGIHADALAQLGRERDAHVDALVIGGERAHGICIAHKYAGTPGGTQALARALVGRHDLKGLLELAEEVSGVADADPDRVRAFAAGLAIELTPGQLPRLFGRLSEKPAYFNALAALAGTVRHPAAPEILRQLEAGEPPNAIVCWALGRLGDITAVGVLDDVFDHGSDEARQAAAVALLRLGRRDVIDRCARALPAPWALRPLAYAGGKPATDAVQKLVLGSVDPSPESLACLGVLGDSTHLDALLAHLGNPSTEGAAAEALALLTGAPLYSSLPDDTRFSPAPATERQAWDGWLEENLARLAPLGRLRHGKAYAEPVLLESLAAGVTPLGLRETVAEELAIRYGVDPGIEPAVDLEGLRTKKLGSGKPTTPGRWLFAGKTL